MRCSESNGNLSVRAIVGANVVILAIDIDEAALDQETRDLLGFAIERIEYAGGQVFERYWLRGPEGVGPEAATGST